MASVVHLKLFPQEQYSDQLLWKVAFVAFVVVCLYARVLADLAKDWWIDPRVSYGLLIPPLALYIAWLKRKGSIDTPRRADSRGLFLIAGACALYVLGILGAEFFLPRISFVLLLAGLIWTFLGASQLRLFAFPLFILATMIPLPLFVYNFLASPLQLLASNCATTLAQTWGISAYREGNIIHLANMSLGVEEACSGLNSLSALMVAGILLGFAHGFGTIARCVLCVLSIPIAITVNILRVAGTAILADHNPEFAGGFYHSFSGWLVFVLGFVWLYAASAVLLRLAGSRKAS